MSFGVAISRCARYEDVEAALARCLDSLGTMRAFVRPGDRVLIKLNLVSPRKQRDAVTTDPALVAAIVREIRSAGGTPSVGDSPALATAEAVAHRSGLLAVSRSLDVPIVDLCDPIIVPTPEARRVPAVQLSRRLRAFDVIVNVPKLKTHCFVGMTGAVKNMFGCIPGKIKTAQHLLHRSPTEFSEMLLDVHAAVRPALTIVDAVVGQEGPGPGSGFPRRFGLLIAGPDAEAVDAVCAKILGFSEREVPTVWLSRKRGRQGADLANVEVLGERLRDVLVKDLKKPRASATTHLPAFVMDAGKRLLCARPVVRPEHCLGCGDCVRICSPHAISMKERVPQFDDRECIRCLCCHEICPHGAIDLRAGLLAQILGTQRS